MWVAITVFWTKVLKPFIKKYWWVILLAVVIVIVVFYIMWLQRSISNLEETVQKKEDLIAKQAFEMTMMVNELANREKDLDYKDKIIALLNETKEKEIIREKHYHTQIENNKVIVEEYERDENLLPVLCKIESYFGITSDECVTQ